MCAEASHGHNQTHFDAGRNYTTDKVIRNSFTTRSKSGSLDLHLGWWHTKPVAVSEEQNRFA
jgi:hypothetical protein